MSVCTFESVLQTLSRLHLLLPTRSVPQYTLLVDTGRQFAFLRLFNFSSARLRLYVQSLRTLLNLRSMVQFIDKRPPKAGIASSRRRRRRNNTAPEPYYQASNGETVFQTMEDDDFAFSNGVRAEAPIDPHAESSAGPSNDGYSITSAPKRYSNRTGGVGPPATGIEENAAYGTLKEQKQQIEFLMDQLRQRDSLVARLQQGKHSAFSLRDSGACRPRPLQESSFGCAVADGGKTISSEHARICPGTASKLEEAVRSPPRKVSPGSQQHFDSANQTATLTGCRVISARNADEGATREPKSGKNLSIIGCYAQEMPVSISLIPRIEGPEKAHQMEIKALVEDRSRSLTRIADQYASQISELVIETTRLQQSVVRHTSDLEAAANEHRMTIESLVAEHAEEMRRLEKTLRDSAAARCVEHEKAFAERERNHSAELDTVRIQAVEDRRSLRIQLSETCARKWTDLEDKHRCEMDQAVAGHVNEVKALNKMVAAWERRASRRKSRLINASKLVDELKTKNSACRCGGRAGSSDEAKAFCPRRLLRPSPGQSVLETLESSSPAKHEARAFFAERGRNRPELGMLAPVDDFYHREHNPTRKRARPSQPEDDLARAASAETQQSPPQLTYAGEPILVCTTRRGGKARTSMVIYSPPRDDSGAVYL